MSWRTASIIHDVQHARRALEVLERNPPPVPLVDSRRVSVFTAHNYNEATILEKSLDALSVENYEVINRPVEVWSHSIRILWFLDYLTSERCRTPYVLYCDSDDVILRDHPETILDRFLEFDCEMLFCSTRWPHGYKCMPEIRDWADQLHPNRYLNGGVCIGKRTTMIEVYSEVARYVSENDTEGNPDSAAFYRDELSYKGRFPHGVGCDQAILRFLEPSLFPRLKIDAGGEIIWRNDNRTPVDKLMKSLKKIVPGRIKAAVKGMREGAKQ